MASVPVPSADPAPLRRPRHRRPLLRGPRLAPPLVPRGLRPRRPPARPRGGPRADPGVQGRGAPPDRAPAAHLRHASPTRSSWGRGTTGRTPTSTTPSSGCCARRAWARRWSPASSSPTASRSSPRPTPPRSSWATWASSPCRRAGSCYVTVTHRDPREAALWANTLGDVYIEQSLASRVDSARKAYEWLQERLAATQQGMRDAQDKLFQSYRTQDLFVPEGSVSAVSTSIAKLNEDFVQAQARRIAIEAALKQAREMQARGEELDALPQVATDPAVTAFNTQIAGLTVELGRLGEKFKEGHPEVQKVKAQVEQLKKAKQARAAQILDGLDAEYTQLRKREAELRGAIDSQKAQAANQSRKATELEALRKEADSAKGLYEVLLQKLNETDIAASIRSNNVSVVDRASPPQDPVRPQKRRSALAGMLLGLLAGLGLVLVRDYLGNTIRDPEEIERYLHLDLLAAVPRYEEENDSLATEAYQNLRTALLFARRRRGRTGGARHRHRAPGGEDDHDRQPRQAPRGLGREDGGGGLRPAPRPDAPAAGAAARAGLHRLLRPARAGVGAAAADLVRQPLRAHRGPAPAQPARAPRAQDAGRAPRGAEARVRLGAHRLAAARLRHRRAAARAARRPHRARHPAQQGGQEAGQAQRGRPAQGDPEPARGRAERGGRAGAQLPVLLLPAARRRAAGRGRSRPPRAAEWPGSPRPRRRPDRHARPGDARSRGGVGARPGGRSTAGAQAPAPAPTPAAPARRRHRDRGSRLGGPRRRARGAARRRARGAASPRETSCAPATRSAPPTTPPRASTSPGWRSPWAPRPC